jgi:hypothetical protein
MLHHISFAAVLIRDYMHWVRGNHRGEIGVVRRLKAQHYFPLLKGDAPFDCTPYTAKVKRLKYSEYQTRNDVSVTGALTP